VWRIQLVRRYDFLARLHFSGEIQLRDPTTLQRAAVGEHTRDAFPARRKLKGIRLVYGASVSVSRRGPTVQYLTPDTAARGLLCQTQFRRFPVRLYVTIPIEMITQLHAREGREHGRTIPLAAYLPAAYSIRPPVLPGHKGFRGQRGIDGTWI
jgi:hypothetical protein